jgi:hypothetical protein
MCKGMKWSCCAPERKLLANLNLRSHQKFYEERRGQDLGFFLTEAEEPRRELCGGDLFWQ